MDKDKIKFNQGFTLIELMTSISIFIIIMTIAMGSIINIFNANRKSHTIRTVMNNLNLSIESMSREMRFGTHYHCGIAGTLTTPHDCPAGDTFMAFLSSDGTQIIYRLNGTTLEKKVGADPYIPVTAPDLVIDNLTFYTVGSGTSNTLQAKVFIKIKSHVGSGTSRSDLDLQTLVSQRKLDI